jgi:hypothetical protein
MSGLRRSIALSLIELISMDHIDLILRRSSIAIISCGLSMVLNPRFHTEKYYEAHIKQIP